MFGSSFAGKPISTAIPALSSRAPTRSRAGTAATSPCRCTITVGPAIEPHHAEAPRQPLAEEYVVTVGKPRLGDQLARARLRSPRQLRSRGSARRPRGADIVSRPQAAQTCSSKRPSAAPAVRPSATRLRCQGGSTGSRVRSTGFFRGGRAMGSVMPHRPEQRGAAAQPAIVVDHAEPADEADARFGTAAPSTCPVSCRTASTSPR